MNQDWNFHLNPILTSPILSTLKEFLQNERLQGKNICPAAGDVFQAYALCSYYDTRVVILGKDPANSGTGAHGLCFSSNQIGRTPELQGIFTEIYRDLNIQYDFNISQEEMFPGNNLSRWAENGFLLLNTSLTGEVGNPGAHSNRGWEGVIRGTITALNARDKPIVYLLWGEEANSYSSIISEKHIVLSAPYPTDRGFLGSKHFSILRDILPEIYNEDERRVIDMTPFFKRTKAMKFLKEAHPMYADQYSKYILEYLTIPIWLNPHHRLKYYEEFKDMLSTKLEIT